MLCFRHDKLQPAWTGNRERAVIDLSAATASAMGRGLHLVRADVSMLTHSWDPARSRPWSTSWPWPRARPASPTSLVSSGLGHLQVASWGPQIMRIALYSWTACTSGAAPPRMFHYLNCRLLPSVLCRLYPPAQSAASPRLPPRDLPQWWPPRRATRSACSWASRYSVNRSANTIRLAMVKMALRGPGRKYGTPVSGWQQKLVSRIGVPDHTWVVRELEEEA